MAEQDVEIALQKAHEAFPAANRGSFRHGNQFISQEFKPLLMQVGMTPTTTSPYYPQSNGKFEAVIKPSRST